MARIKSAAAVKKSEELANKRRRQIFTAAATVFAQKGYHNATVREIAEEANLGKGTLYEYIDSKKDLLYLVMEEAHSMLFAEWDRIKTKDIPPDEKFREAIHTQLTLTEEYSQAARALIPEILGMEATDREIMEEQKVNYIEKFRYFFDKCVEAGIFQDIDGFAACELLSTCVLQWGKSDSLKNACNNSVEQFEEYLMNMVLHGILKSNQ